MREHQPEQEPVAATMVLSLPMYLQFQSTAPWIADLSEESSSLFGWLTLICCLVLFFF
jgi:hypothetical protein